MNVKRRGGGGQFQLRKVGGRVKKVGNLCSIVSTLGLHQENLF